MKKQQTDTNNISTEFLSEFNDREEQSFTGGRHVHVIDVEWPSGTTPISGIAPACFPFPSPHPTGGLSVGRPDID